VQSPAGAAVIRRPRGWTLAASLWAVVIVVFGVIPTHETLAAAVGRHENSVASLAHFVECAVFAFLLAVALGGWRLRACALTAAAVLAVGLGWVIELVQLPLPYRDFQVSDGLTDMAGVAAGLAVFSGLVLWREARPRAHHG
jgi:VanZ family protein